MTGRSFEVHGVLERGFTEAMALARLEAAFVAQEPTTEQLRDYTERRVKLKAQLRDVTLDVAEFSDCFHARYLLRNDLLVRPLEPVPEFRGASQICLQGHAGRPRSPMPSRALVGQTSRGRQPVGDLRLNPSQRAATRPSRPREIVR